MKFFDLRKRKKEVKFEESDKLMMIENTNKFEITKNIDSNIQRKSEGEIGMSNPLMRLTETELRDLCRHHIDTFENWSRRIINETFKSYYDSDYFNFMISVAL